MAMSISMLMLLVAIGVILWITRGFVRWLKHWRRPYSYDNYITDHPDCVTSGSVRCHRCGGKSIYITRVGYTPLTRRHAHICRRCGTTLYFSRTHVERTHDQDE